MSETKIDLSLAPMEAKSADVLPEGEEWHYEPKWDGFRCIVHRDSDKVDLISKTGQPLGRYFPEVVQAISQLKSNRFVIDGELVVGKGKKLSFDLLQQRIHPAESRINKLSLETPASFIFFDLLVDDEGNVLLDLPFAKRREALLAYAAKYIPRSNSFIPTPATADRNVAQHWLDSDELSIDGVIAKRSDLPYQSGNRDGMLKVKRKHTADCVVGGFRYGTNSKTVASLLLGLYDKDGGLHHVGFTSALGAQDKKKLTKELEALIATESFTVNVPGEPNRWSTSRSADWQPLQPLLVVEVQYDHITKGRFRHATKLLRWRTDKSPEQCTMDQMTGH